MSSRRTQELISHFMSKGILQQQDHSIRPIKMPNTGAQDFAAYMLTHSSGDRKTAKMFGQSLASRTHAEEEKAGVLSSLFDALSSGLYSAHAMVENQADNALNLAERAGIGHGAVYNPEHNKQESLGKDVLDLFTTQGKAVAGGAAQAIETAANSPFSPAMSPVANYLAPKIKGFADKQAPKKGFESNLHTLGVNNKIARYGGGFALDMAADPLSYVGGFFSKAKSVKDILDLKAASPESADGISQMFKKEQAVAGGLAKPGHGFKLPEAPPVAEDAVSSPMLQNPLHQNPVPQIGRQQVPGVQPMMDAIKFQPRTRELARRWGQQETKMASDVEKGLVDIPDPARNAVEKLRRADNDWQRAMMRAGKVAEPSGRFSTRSANQIVNDILSGKTARYAVVAPKAVGEEAQKARNIADNLIDDLMGPKRATKEMPQKTGSFLRRPLIKEVQPGQQVALFNKILRDGDVGKGGFEAARGMLASAEDHLITLGVQPIWHNGLRVRLSDVLEATHGKVPFAEVIKNFSMSNMDKMNPVVRASIQGLAAQRTIGMSEITANLTKLTEKARRELVNYSPIERPLKESEIAATSIEAAMQRGMTNAEISSVKDLVKDIVDIDKLPADKWVLRTRDELVKASKEGRVSKKLVNDFNKAIAEGIGITPGKLATNVSGIKAVDYFMSHYTTWWGKGDWQNISKDVFDAAEDNAVARARMMRQITFKYKPEEIRAAWRHAAQIEESDDPASLELATFFHNYMRTVYKVQEHGFNATNELYKEMSVAEKSTALMEDVNRTLKQMNGHNAFQFTNSQRARNATGAAVDYSQGSDWMKSWDRWDPHDPVAFLYDLDLAMERTTKEYSFLDSFVGTFGSLKQTPEHNYYMNLSRIKGFWVPEQHGKAVERVMNDLYKGGYHPTSATGRLYSKGLRIWKTGVTIYLPSHHIRNAIGDINLMWLAGHNDPRAFIWSRRIMASQRTKYKDIIKRGDFDALEQLTSPEAMKWAETRGGDIIINQNGTRVTADQLYIAAHQHGLLRDAYAYEDIFGEAPLGQVASGKSYKKIIQNPLGGKVHDAATAAAEYREHYIRLAHFSSAINKGLKRSKNLQKVMQDAAAEVRKWHPDGRDLTFTEQKLRMVIPFYSWVRKSSPLLLQSLVTAPAKQLAAPRAAVAMQGMMGIEGTTVADPYPDDQVFPEWIRSYGIGPIGDPESENVMARWWGNLGRNMIAGNGAKYGYTIVNPSNPLIDAGAQFGGFGPRDTAQGVWDSVTPFVKVPVELGGTHREFTGAPIYKDEGGRGVLRYLSKQIPFTSPLQRITNAGDKQRDDVEGGMDTEALINIMTAAGVRGTGPYIKSAEFEQRDKNKARQ